MKFAAIIAAFFFLAMPVQAQVAVEASGGFSNLTPAAGAGIHMWLPTSEVRVGLLTTPSPHFGITYDFTSHGYRFAIGDENFNLGEVPISERGLAVEKVTRFNDFTLFAGATGVGYFQPFAQGFSLHTFGTGFIWQHTFTSGTFDSYEAIHGHYFDVLQSFTWKNKLLELGGTGGLLDNRRFMDGRLVVHPTPWFVTSVSHDDRWVPNHVSYNSLMIAANAPHFSAWASGFQGQSGTAEAAGVNLRASIFNLDTSIYHNLGQPVFVSVTVGGTWNQFTGNTTWSNGRFSAGGGYSGNYFSVGVSHEIQYALNGPLTGLQQFTVLTLALRIPGTDVALNFLGSLDSHHHLRSTEYAHDYAYGAGSSGDGGTAVSLGGKYVVNGLVIDAQGKPVAGAAIKLDGKQEVWTNAAGEFSVRFRKRKAVTISIVLADFTSGGIWRIVTCPVTVVPTREGSSLKIVLDNYPGHNDTMIRPLVGKPKGDTQ